MKTRSGSAIPAAFNGETMCQYAQEKSYYHEPGQATDRTGPRQMEVGAEMDRLAEAVEVLGKTAEQLTQRLSVVRRKTGDIGKGEQSAPQPVLCPMASIIRDRREAIERYTAQLSCAIDELEI